MPSLQPSALVESVLAYDLEPPDSNYSPYEYGARVAHDMNSDSVKETILACFERLPGTTTASFLDGLLATRSCDSIDSVLFQCLPHTFDLGAASHIVEYLGRFANLINQQIADRVLDEMQVRLTVDQQDRLAFAFGHLFAVKSTDVALACKRNQCQTYSIV